MKADVYQLDGKIAKSIELPSVFNASYREDLVKRALLAEQSTAKQPQGHFLLAGMQTTARYYGSYGSYRTGRHMGIAIRPRQKLGGGAQGDVRRIPSAVKGKRAHPHKIEKIITERINAKEYRRAVESAIASTANAKMITEIHPVKTNLPIVIEDKIESVSKTKEVMKILKDLKLVEDVEKSHKPQLRKGLRRASQRRHFRNSVLFVVKEAKGLDKSARNIPGVDVVKVNELSVQKLAPGARPRITIWSEKALNDVESELAKLKAR